MHSITRLIRNTWAGRGYGTELLNWSCEYIFNVLGLHRCEIKLYAENIPALRCYEKVGFSLEGREKECRFVDGQWKDCLNMALLDHEWRDKQAKKLVAGFDVTKDTERSSRST